MENVITEKEIDEKIHHWFLESARVKEELARTQRKNMAKIAAIVIDAIRNGNTIFACGNGGSMGDALHLTEELTGRYKKNRKPLPGLCLGANQGSVSCIGNDFGYDDIFCREVQAFGKKGDVLIGFSTSGNSLNVIKAMGCAKAQGLKTIALLGKDGGKMKGMCDVEIIVPSNESSRIQESHMLIYHSLIELVDDTLFPEGGKHE